MAIIAKGKENAAAYARDNVGPGDLLGLRWGNSRRSHARSVDIRGIVHRRSGSAAAWLGSMVQIGSFTPDGQLILKGTIAGILHHEIAQRSIEPRRGDPLTNRTRLIDGMTVEDREGEIARLIGGEWFYWDNPQALDTSYLIGEGARILTAPVEPDDVVDAEIVDDTP